MTNTKKLSSDQADVSLRIERLRPGVLEYAVLMLYGSDLDSLSGDQLTKALDVADGKSVDWTGTLLSP